MPSVSTAPRRAAGSAAGASRVAGIVATGSCVPDGVLSNAELERMVDTSNAWIMERTGIAERHRAGSGVTTSVLAAEAGRRAMRQAGVDSVDAIILATCTPDTFVPSAACLVQRRLGLGGIPAFDVNAACSGFIYGLAIGRSLIEQGALDTVLLIGAETLTALVDYTDRATCVIFGDGAAAAVVGVAQTGGIRALRWAADGEGADLICYGPRVDEDGRPAGADGIRMLGKGTFRLAVEHMTETAEQLLADAGWSAADVDLVVPHQANLRIIEAVAKRLSIGMDRVVVNIERMGNTSAASIPLALDEALAQGRLHAGQRVLCIGFGAGTTWGGVAIEWPGPAPR